MFTGSLYNTVGFALRWLEKNQRQETAVPEGTGYTRKGGNSVKFSSPDGLI